MEAKVNLTEEWAEKKKKLISVGEKNESLQRLSAAKGNDSVPDVRF